MHLLHILSQLFYPSLCRACESVIPPSHALCLACTSSITPVVSVYVPLSAQKSVKVYAAAAYQGVMKTLVLKKISSDLTASKHLGTLITQLLPLHQIPCDYLIPIPLHWSRYARRGFNQAHEIAKVLSKENYVPIAPLLMRVKHTQFQSSLDAASRQHNVAHAFDISWRYRLTRMDQFKDKDLVIVDDLFTTGATITHAAKALAPLKPRSVSAIVACRAI